MNYNSSVIKKILAWLTRDSSAQPVSRFEAVLAILFVGAIAAATYVRLYFGVSVGDEAHQVAEAYLPLMGGTWFVDEKVIQQMASMVFTPFLWLYSRFAGTYGIILFVRHLHFFLSLCVAGVTFGVFRHFARWTVALLVAALVMAFVPHAVASLSYNTLGSLFFGLASGLGLLAVLGRRSWLAVLSGVFWVLCGFVYPTLILAFAFNAVAMLWFFSTDPEMRRRVLFPLIAGVLLTAIAMGGFLLSFGIENIKSAVEYSSLFNSPGSLGKLIYAFRMSWVYLPTPYFVLPYAVVWMVVARRSPLLNSLFLFGFLGAYLAFGGNYESTPAEVLWPILQFFVVLYFVTKKNKLAENEKYLVVFCIVPAIMGSLACCLTSRMTLYAMCLTAIFGAAATMILFVGRARLGGWLVALLILPATTYGYYQLIYEDDRLGVLNYRISEGPFAGLYTFEQKALQIEGIQSDLEKAGIHDKTILFKDLFPGGYLMAANRVVGPTLYIAPANFYPEARALYAQIFSDRKYWPEVVVELKYYPVRIGDLWPYNVADLDPYRDPFRDFFMQSGAYSVLLDRESYRFLVRKP